MFRPLLALALLALALPAQSGFYDPTNVTRSGTGPVVVDILNLNGRWHVVMVGTEAIDVRLAQEKSPGRVDVGLAPVSVLALDSRPCARDGLSYLSWASLPWLQIPQSGTLWWAGTPPFVLTGPAPRTKATEEYRLSYGGFTNVYTSCQYVYGPELIAVLFEIVIR